MSNICGNCKYWQWNLTKTTVHLNSDSYQRLHGKCFARCFVPGDYIYDQPSCDLFDCVRKYVCIGCGKEIWPLGAFESHRKNYAVTWTTCFVCADCKEKETYG